MQLDGYMPPLLSVFCISMYTLSPTLIPISSYSGMLNFMVGESVSPGPINPMFVMTLGMFFMRSSIDVTFWPNGFIFGLSGLYSFGSLNVTYTYGLPS